MKKEWRNGLLGALSLLFLYFLVMTVAGGGWSATVSQFRQFWYWMLILATGFGTQIGLFTKLHLAIKKKSLGGNTTAVAATSTGTSAVAMIACCAHHLTDVLPVIGLSGAALFLTQYQIPLIILGVVMNAFGILYMVGEIDKVQGTKSALGWYSRQSNENKVLMTVFVAVVLIVGYTITTVPAANNQAAENSSGNQAVPAAGKTTLSNGEGNVTVEVTPQVLEKGKKPQFQIAINNHSISLEFDITKITVLTDDKGNSYEDSTWDGAPPGGHHRSGTLTFSKPLTDASAVELTVRDIAGIAERKFKWNL